MVGAIGHGPGPWAPDISRNLLKRSGAMNCFVKIERQIPVRPVKVAHRIFRWDRTETDRPFHLTFDQNTEISGCFPLCQTDRSEISVNTRGKWNDIFRLNRANQ